jgi:hypothetical protein
MNNNLLQCFWKNNFRPLFSFRPHNFLIFSPFWVIKNLMGVPTKIYNNKKKSKRKKCNDQRFKFEILIYFNSPMTKQWNPLTPNGCKHNKIDIFWSLHFPNK